MSDGETTPGEQDTQQDRQTAGSRATGGVAHDNSDNGGDRESTTGPGANETFVGRVAGNDDVGSVGETGAEARAEHERGNR